MDTNSTAETDGTTRRRWYKRLGPGLITACVVIGPGSILTSSQTGAANGYRMSWIIALAVFFMMVYTSLGARLGVVTRESPGDLITQRQGRWLALIIGLGVFFISAAFQFGNNLGLASAFEVFIGEENLGLLTLIVIAFNGLSILFLFWFQDLYKAVERLMMTFVGLMIVAFAINLFFAGPDPADMAAGFIPGFSPAGPGAEDDPLLKISVLGLVGTTFVITAAYFQSYLVQQKGWDRKDLKDGLLDARVGSVILAIITLMIMSTAAAVFHDFELGQARAQLGEVADVARQLEPSIGRHAQLLFCLGVFAAAYSSFLINSMIGGYILSDGLGLGSSSDDLAPKLLTTGVLLTGMGVALFVLYLGFRPVPAIVAAQATTVLASPLMALALWWLTTREDVMGEDVNGPIMNVCAGFGFLVLLAMSYYTATAKVWPAVRDWISS